MSRPSLGEEKQALLAKMEASRVAYRRVLQGVEEERHAVQDVVTAGVFPKSHTVRFILDHPYLCTFALAALLVGPRRLSRGAQHAARRVTPAASAVMRHQGKLRLALGMATAVMRIVARHRG